MTRQALASAVRNVRAALAAGGPAGPGDRDLLQAFSERHDSSAFTAIVRRYGPLVLGVCRRELGHEQDAEDAFQATFLALARKPGAVRKAESLAGWLYGTARRVALRAKRDAARRRAREARAGRAASPDPVGELTWREVREALDEEVRRLPATYRDAFVLCCLEGVAHAEVARWLGRSPGTVSSQVSRARERLRGRLARRGIELSLALGALAVGSAGRAAVPASLAGVTARLATACAAGQSALGLSPQALSLADGALRGMPATRAGLAAVLLLGLGLLGARAAAYCRGTPSAKEPPAPAASAPKPPREATTTLAGRVLGPDGKPVKGAHVAVWSGGKIGPPVRTDAEGRFRLTVGAKQATGAKVIARAEGFGPDWAGVGGKSKELTLRLVKDDVPITGRILDLEGKPVAGVSVEVQRVGKVAGGGDLGGWLDRNARMRKEGSYLNENGLDVVEAGALGPRALTTDKGGRFRLAGFGRDRVVRLLVRGETVEHARLWAVTRSGPKRGWVPGPFPVYAATFDHLAAPTKPIAGTVRDRRTGKPLAGIVVEGGPSMHVGTTTDARGRYRLVGIAKSHRGYWLSAGGGPGRPYFDLTRSGIADTPGLGPITVDIELERGVEITGRVTDAVTGKPVPGTVMYFHTPDNPKAKDYVTLDLPKVLVSDWGRIAPDGSFTVLGIPGPGALVVCASEGAGYPVLNVGRELRKRKVLSSPVAPAHAVVWVDVSEKDPKTRRQDITLARGGARAGTLTGPDGKPLAGARVAGLAPGKSPEKLEGPRFAARGMGARNVYLLIFVHEEKKLGKVQVVRGDEKGPADVRLEPLGALAGRLVDGDGNPVPGQYVRAIFSVKGGEYDNLPLEVLNRAGVFGGSRSAWNNFTSRLAKTDKDGRFRIEGLIGGAKYWLAVAEGPELSAPLRFLVRGGKSVEVSAGPGKTKDLGEVKEASFR